MDWKELDKETASSLFDEYCSKGNLECPRSFVPLRNDLWSAFSSTLKELNINPAQIKKGNLSYQVDYRYGIKLYTLLCDKYGMSVRDASSSGIWRYLSLCVIPDIVGLRYGTSHPDRYWKRDRRIWLRVLWWYIHLSWQGDASTTAEIIKDNSTDEILQLVDRCGRGGYRVPLYREIMKQLSTIKSNDQQRHQVFRRIMVLNTARSQVIEPDLVDGGIQKYVSDLIKYLR